MVFKKIIFQNRYVALETPSRHPPFMANTILNFHFDYLHHSLTSNFCITVSSFRRYAMYKVGPILSISHGMGIPSAGILLHEVSVENILD